MIFVAVAVLVAVLVAGGTSKITIGRLARHSVPFQAQPSGHVGGGPALAVGQTSPCAIGVPDEAGLVACLSGAPLHAVAARSGASSSAAMSTMFFIISITSSTNHDAGAAPRARSP